MLPRKRRLCLGGLFLICAVGIAAVLFYRYADAIRVYVVRPAIESYFIARYYVATVPQLFWWLIPPVVVSLILLRRLLRSPKPSSASRPTGSRAVHPGEGELTNLSRLLRQAHHSRFARVRLSRTLAEIAARLIARREGRTLTEARRMMAGGYWRASGSMHHFLTPRKHYTTRQDNAEFDAALRETLDQLEAYDRSA